MDPIIGGGLIEAGGALLGGLLGDSRNASEAEKTRGWQDWWNHKNIELQKEFAQNGIRWKMEDAARAGIHPLAALGAQGQSFSPLSVGDSGFTPSGMGNAVAEMGQSIGRAVSAQSTAAERTESKLRLASLEQDVIGKQLQNSLLRQQAATASVGPGLPSNSGLPGSLLGAGQGDAYVVEKPLQTTHSAKGAPFSEVGSIPEVGWTRTATGGLAPVPSADAKQRIEDQVLQEITWSIRNNLMPSIGLGTKPPKDVWPKGAVNMKFNPTLQHWYPVYDKPVVIQGPPRPVRPGQKRKFF